MFSALANPARFMAFSRWAAPILGVIAVGLIGAGLWLGLNAPPDGLYFVEAVYPPTPPSAEGCPA